MNPWWWIAAWAVALATGGLLGWNDLRRDAKRARWIAIDIRRDDGNQPSTTEKENQDGR